MDNDSYLTHVEGEDLSTMDRGIRALRRRHDALRNSIQDTLTASRGDGIGYAAIRTRCASAGCQTHFLPARTSASRSASASNPRTCYYPHGNHRHSSREIASSSVSWDTCCKDPHRPRPRPSRADCYAAVFAGTSQNDPHQRHSLAPRDTESTPAASHLLPSCNEGHDPPRILSPREAKEKGRALLEAARSGRLQDVRQLLREGASASYSDSSNSTAMHLAATEGHTGVVSALVSSHGNIDASDISGDTPLHLAASRGNIHVLQLLLSAGATVNARNNLGSTPLHEAALSGYPQCCQILLEAGASPNILTNQRNSPLHFAAYSNIEQCVLLLIRGGADPSVRNTDGQTAKDSATEPAIQALFPQI